MSMLGRGRLYLEKGWSSRKIKERTTVAYGIYGGNIGLSSGIRNVGKQVWEVEKTVLLYLALA